MPSTSANQKSKKKAGNKDNPIAAVAVQGKTIWLIRHGQSEGQAAKQNGLDRKRDRSLIDCGLTQKGVQQAYQIPMLMNQINGELPPQIDLVISSPLTRALQTAILGFQQYTTATSQQIPPFLIHYGLREVGSSIPENLPRGDIDAVFQYLQERHVLLDGLRIDSDTLKPPNWPNDNGNDCGPQSSMSRAERIPQIFRWIASERPEQCIAVVCHYNVIRSALTNHAEVRPKNALPIRCRLLPDGTLQPY